MRFLMSVRPRTILVAVLSTLAAAALAACGASGGGNASGPATAASVTPPSSGCGSFPAPPPKDPDDVLGLLSKEHQDALARYPIVYESAWKNWRPNHGPPYSVGIAVAGGVDPLQTTIFKDLQQMLEASPAISDVNFYSTGTELDVALQLQLYSQAVQKRPDIMIAEPLQPQAFLRAETKAGKAGIPTVNFLGDVQSPYALNINTNFFLSGALMSSWLVRAVGQRGDILYVHGYPGTTADDGMFGGLKDVVHRCPGVKIAGDVIGAFVNAAAKQEVLKFVSTHPAPLAAVLQGGGMGAGVVSAFTSTGRNVPVLGDGSAVQGSLVYWKKHIGSYRAVGSSQPAHWAALAVADVVLRTLQGQGPRINTLLPAPDLFTEKELDAWVDPSASESSDVAAEGPRDSFLGDNYLDGLFDSGSKPKGLVAG